MSAPCLIGVDAGTTGITAVVYDLDLIPHTVRSEDFAQHFPAPGWVEHDAREIRTLALRLVKEVAREAPGPIGAVGITNQRETVVPLDLESGNPLRNAIVWQCRRTSARCAELKAEGREPRVRQLTGLVLDPYFSASKMAWLLDHDASCARAAARGSLRMVTIDTLLVHALSAGRTLATDPTNASRTLLFDIDRRAWSAELRLIFGLPEGLLAEVRPSAGDFGETDPNLVGFRAPITGVLGDQQAALFGHGCFAPGDAKNTYGTGCFLLANAGTVRPASVPGVLTTLGADPRGEPIFVQEGAVFVAGAALQWLRDGLQILGAAEDSERLAASLPDNGGVYLVPAFTGLGAPYWDPDARGLLCGLTRGTTRAHLARAALEAIAYQVHDLFELFRSGGEAGISSLRVDGGATQNAWLMQFQADLLSVPLTRGRDLEVTCRGAALLAGVGAGLISDPRAVRALAEDRTTFSPAGQSLERTARLTGWHAAVARARSPTA